MTKIITKTAKDGRTIEINKISYSQNGPVISATINGEVIASGFPLEAIVKGRPEINHVFNGKIPFTDEEMKTIWAAFASDMENELAAIGRKIEWEDNRRKIENA